MSEENPELETEVSFYQNLEQVEDTPEEAAEQEQPEEEAQADTEDSEAENEDESEHDATDEELYVDIDGREITLKQIKEWEEGELRQSDYTRKTQALAEERRKFEAGKEEEIAKVFSEKYASLDSTIEELEALIAVSDEEVSDLDEYDPDYIDNEKLKAKRKAAIEKARSAKTELESKQSQEKAAAVQSELVAMHPEWLDDSGEQTEAFKSDLKAISDYFAKVGISQEDQAEIKSAKVWEAIIVAAKNEKKAEKASETKKKVRKLPVSTKPSKKPVSSAPKSDDELFYGSK